MIIDLLSYLIILHTIPYIIKGNVLGISGIYKKKFNYILAGKVWATMRMYSV